MSRGCIKADDCGAFLLKGEKGVTFTPIYDPETGILSWTNDGGLENPPPVCIKGKIEDTYTEITDDEIEDIIDGDNTEDNTGDNTGGSGGSEGSGDSGGSDDTLGDDYYEITDDEIDDILKS